jgi:hypothetical protein
LDVPIHWGGEKTFQLVKLAKNAAMIGPIRKKTSPKIVGVINNHGATFPYLIGNLLTKASYGGRNPSPW